MSIDILKAELTDDPLSRGYSSMNDLAAAADLNTIYRTKLRDAVSGSEIFNVTDTAEYTALTNTQKASWDALCAIDSINTSSGVAKAKEAELFGAGTTTRSNLLALRKPPASRAEELGLGIVYEGHIQEARI